MAGRLHAATGSLRPIRRALIAAAALPACGVAAAADLLSQTGKLGTQVQDLPFPGLGRVIAAFVITVAIAIGAAFALRRFWPALRSRRSGVTSIRILDRSVVSGALTVSVVEIDGSKYLIAEGRSGVGVVPVQSGPQSEAGRTP